VTLECEDAGIAETPFEPACTRRQRWDRTLMHPTAANLSAHDFTHENVANFLGVGVQLLPVFWLILAVETTWLKSGLLQFQSNTEGSWRRAIKRSIYTNVLAISFPVGALAECFAFLALMGVMSTSAEFVAALWLFLALVFSVIAAAIAMLRAVFLSEDDFPGEEDDEDEEAALSAESSGGQLLHAQSRSHI
jgi:hypothetical protein